MNFIDLLMLGLILTNLMLLGSSRLRMWIRIVAAQGLLLGLLPVLVLKGQWAWQIPILAAGSIGLRGICFPWLLLRMLRESKVRHEVEPYVGYSISLILGVLALVGSLWAGGRISLPAQPPSELAIPVAVFTIFVGLFLIISRKKAISQVLGYLVMESGIYVLGISLVVEVPMLVELGVLLDAFVAVLVMSLATYEISRKFDHTDVDQLDKLKG